MTHALSRRLVVFGMVVLALGIYSYPAIRTTISTGSRQLPPIFAPDVSLYLSLSNLKTAQTGEVLNPYYGVPVPPTRMGYLKFRLAFVLFRQLTVLLHGNLWLSLFLWNLIWWGLLCAIVLWFFATFLPDKSLQIVLFGVGLLLLFNFGILKPQFVAWLQVSSLSGFRNVELPFIRPFFPQLPVPLLILYLGLQAKVLRKGTSLWLWVVMGIVQFVAFAIFPYATLMMAGITVVAAAGQFFTKFIPLRWPMLLTYGATCAGSDWLFFVHGAAVSRTGAPGHYSLVQLHLSELPRLAGGTWLLLAVLTLAIPLCDLRPEVKWSLAGLGLSNLCFLLGDVFFSVTALQVSHHAGYFVHMTAAILVTFLLAAAYGQLQRKLPSFRSALAVVVALLILNGMLAAHATYQVFLPLNQQQAELTSFFRSGLPRASDLVIARSLLVDDACSWVPLLSDARVLFCRNAQVLLTPEQNEQIQRFRQALYLYFTGRDSAWVESILADPHAIDQLTQLTFLGQVTASNPVERMQAINAVRSELIPELDRAGHNDSQVTTFFRQYAHVIVIDDRNHSNFVATRLESYLKIEQSQTLGSLLVLVCSPA